MGIVIINQGWTDNLGDVAIGKTLKKELKDFHPIELQFAPIVAKPAQTAASKIFELVKLDFRYRNRRRLPKSFWQWPAPVHVPLLFY